MERRSICLTIIVSILFSFLLNGQIINQNIKGDWIKFKAERKDGSRIIDRLGTGLGYLEYSIGKKKLCILNQPIGSKTCTDYSFNGKMLYVGFAGKYKIEKLSNDTLIISEWDLNATGDKLNRIYFIERTRLLDNLIMSGDTVLAKGFSSPKFESDFNGYIFNKIYKDFAIVKFKGYLVIDRNRKEIYTEIIEAPISKKKTLRAIKSAINQSYDMWSFHKYNKNDLIRISFVGKTENIESLKAVKFVFYHDSYEYLDRQADTRLEDITLASQHFQEGIEDVGNNNFDSAIENFSQSYELNPVLIDAIYNRASVYYAIGKVDDACIDWKYLSDLGQKGAANSLAEFCE